MMRKHENESERDEEEWQIMRINERAWAVMSEQLEHENESEF